MLSVNDISYNCAAESYVIENENRKRLADFNFSANGGTSFFFNINYYSLEAINDDGVESDFEEFKRMIIEHFSDVDMDFLTPYEDVIEEETEVIDGTLENELYPEPGV